MRNMFELGVHLNLSLDETQELERIFGPGAAQQQLALEYQTGDKNDVEDVGNESDQDRNTSTSSEETEGEVIDEVSMSDASSTPTREPRGKKRFNKTGLDSSSSLSQVRREAVQSGNKKFRFEKDDTVYDEGERWRSVEGESVHDGEGNTVPQGDGRQFLRRGRVMNN